MNLWIGIIPLLLGVLPYSQGCGQRPFTSGVVNGENAQAHSWPWQISLLWGGSLIDSDWVITAAHYVENNPHPSGYSVVVGAHRRTGTTAVQQTFRLKKLFKHEGFDMRQLQNDIALLQLERPITASEKVNTVCLPAETRERRVTSQGDSGGSFVCNEGGNFVLRGAVSWGHYQCRTDHYTVFARISSFIAWINQKKSG